MLKCTWKTYVKTKCIFLQFPYMRHIKAFKFIKTIVLTTPDTGNSTKQLEFSYVIDECTFWKTT